MILTNAFEPDPRVYKEAKALIENGHSVEILCWDRNNQFKKSPSENIEGIRIKRFFPLSKPGTGFKQLRSYIKFIIEVRKYLIDKEIDVIHSHDIDGMLVGLFISGKKKFIWDMHEFYDGFSYGKVKSFIYELIARLGFRKVDGIICVSDEQKTRYARKIRNTTELTVIFNAPEEKVFENFERIDSPKLRISFIGGVRDFTSIKTLMEACEKLNFVEAHINGKGTEYERIKALENEYKNSIITGEYKYKDIKKLYEDSDCIYAVYDDKLLNIKHAFPVKGLEAIYTETPVIATVNTDFGDFVVNKQIGFTLKYGDVEELKMLIKKISENKDVLEEKKKNMHKLKHEYSWESQIEKLIKLYESL